MPSERSCSVEGCGQRRLAKGLCQAHYLRRRKYGSEDGGGKMRHQMEAICSSSGCDQPRHSLGLCKKHYMRNRRHGDPMHCASVPRPARDWLVAHIDYRGAECLIWPFARLRNGYAAVRDRGTVAVASRVMCELAHGPAPTAGHEAAHSCGRGHDGCVNPDHLRWATHLENVGDQEDHGTVVWGEASPSSKLTEDDVRAIRKMDGAATRREIGDKFGVSRQTAKDVILRRRWGRLA